MGQQERYEKLAKILMDSPDPVRAIASVIGDHEGRIDALCGRVAHMEAQAKAAK